MQPGVRIPYDSDGTVGLIKRSNDLGGDMLDVPSSALNAMNSTMGAGMVVGTDRWSQQDTYDNDSVGGLSAPNNRAFFLLILPVPTRLRGIFLVSSRDFSVSPYNGTAISPQVFATDQNRVEVSRDSTNGVDGTWEFATTAIRGNIPTTAGLRAVDVATGKEQTVSARAVKDYYRLLKAEVGTGIEDLSGSSMRNVTALRVYPLYRDSVGTTGNHSTGSFVLHLYGEPDTGALGSDYLQAWRRDSDMRLGGGTLDWGDVPLGSSSDKAFRLKNFSESKSANNVLVSIEDERYYPSPSPAAQFLFSLDGLTWTPTVSIGSLSSKAISGLVHIRRVTTVNSVLTTWSPKIRFDVGSWA